MSIKIPSQSEIVRLLGILLIKVKILPRDTPESPYINTQCSGDTHVDGEVIFSCRDPKELWDGVRIGGKPLGEVLSRSYIITLN